MRIAIFGATSQIAKDLTLSFSLNKQHELSLFARRPEVATHWLAGVGLSDRYHVSNFTDFRNQEHFDAIINFVGVGNPAQAVAMGASIFEVTSEYDNIAVNYVQQHPNCRYLFLSSGAVYGSNFQEPVDENSKSVISINKLQRQDWYAVAKLTAEFHHRLLPKLPIIDIRVFNYFSHTQDMSARFLITDIVRAIQSQTVMLTSSDFITRDYLHPSDFHQLVNALLSAPATNTAIDCYSLAPVNKLELLNVMQLQFGLKYDLVQGTVNLNATGSKTHYYSSNTRAEHFGYLPTLTSLDGIIKEMQALF